MFLPVFTSQVVGMPVASETMFRSGDPPHIGQLVRPFPAVDDETVAARTPTKLSNRSRLFMSCPTTGFCRRAHCRIACPRSRPRTGRRSLGVRDLVDLLNRPRCRFGGAG